MFRRKAFWGEVIAPLYERDPHVDTDAWIHESWLWQVFGNELAEARSRSSYPRS